MVQNDEKTCGVSKDRLVSLFDSGTFVELSAYTKRSADESMPESVSCGYGAIDGRLAFAFSQDSGRSKGAFSERHAKKIEALYSLAVKNGAPVIGIFDSNGASVYDGASALAAYGRLMKNVSDASGIIPQIAIIDGVCGGAAAVAAAMFDFVITVKDVSKLFVKAPFVVGESVDSAKAGHSVYNAESEADAFAFAKKLASVLPANNADAICVDTADDINRQISLDTEGYNTAELLSTLADDGEFIRLYADYCENMILGFASFGGVLTGVAASNSATDGAIDIKSARAAAKLISFCDSFGLPVLTLVDSIGTEASAEAENASYAEELAKLAYAYTSSDNAKVTVIVGKAYGTAFTLLGSKAIGADMALALPSAEISVLSPEASVAFLWNSRVGEKTRAELEDEWRQTCASATEAADRGEIDYVVEPSELRQRICSALSMLCSKSDSAPSRKHINMPL